MFALASDESDSKSFAELHNFDSLSDIKFCARDDIYTTAKRLSFC